MLLVCILWSCLIYSWSNEARVFGWTAHAFQLVRMIFSLRPPDVVQILEIMGWELPRILGLGMPLVLGINAVRSIRVKLLFSKVRTIGCCCSEAACNQTTTSGMIWVVYEVGVTKQSRTDVMNHLILQILKS